MKPRTLLLSLLMLLTVATSHAQSFAQQAGIAVQGIARDNNNTALANESITFKFTIYYNDPGPVNVYVENVSISTDAFGVFSHILDVDPTTNSSFANNILLLKIEDVSAGTIISDEIFKHVPYAISANNGVPTGSIMPYIGTTAPAGWVLCNGQALNVISGSASLQALVGANAPNLQGMFLRGTGTSPVNSQAGPALKGTQGDDNKSHLHGSGTLKTDMEGNHNHANSDYNQILRNPLIGNRGSTGSVDNGPDSEPEVTSSRALVASGSHDHQITSGSTATTGTESRPVNYGVNYIIKL